MKLMQMLNRLGILSAKSKEEKKLDEVQPQVEIPVEPKSEPQEEVKNEVVLMDLKHLNTKTHLENGKEAFKVVYKNPVKIYPYMSVEHAEIMSEDSLVGEADIYIKNGKVVANVKLLEPFATLSRKMPKSTVLYKPFGYVDLTPNFGKEPDQILVDFIYVLF